MSKKKTRKTDDFPEQQFAVSGGHVDDECFCVATARVDLSQRPVDVASVCHSIDVCFDQVAVQRYRLHELL